MLNNKPKLINQTRSSHLPKLLSGGLFIIAMLGITACGGGSPNNANPGDSGDGSTSGGSFVYKGVNGPRDPQVTSFMDNLYKFIAADNVCASCHVPGGLGRGAFANQDDVNLAYDAAISRVNLDDPAASAMVTKFRAPGGHTCWLPTSEECASRLETWIRNWKIDLEGGAVRTIQLRAPNSVLPQAAVNFPSTVPASFTPLHDLVKTHCIRCHTPSPAGSEPAQSPFFAQATIAASWSVISTTAGLVNLVNPAGSRFVERLQQGHNCWDNPSDSIVAADCVSSRTIMLDAINTLVTDIKSDTSNNIDLSQKIASRAVNLFDDGIAASGGDRYQANLVALYEFKELAGSRLIADTSPQAPPADMTLAGEEGVDYQRLSSWGVRFMHGNGALNSKAFSIANTTSKITQAIRGTGEYSFEMWVIPDDITQMDRTIFSYSANNSLRNFNISQYGYEYRVMHTTNSSTDLSGVDSMVGTGEANELLQASLQHVVVTYDARNGRKVYINGEDSGIIDPETPAGLSNWNETFALTLGNSFNGNRPWHGIMKMLAIHNRAMTLDQVRQNFAVDVGQKYYLMFDISEHLAACQGPEVNTSDALPYSPLCFIYAEAAQFDDLSYLINQPKFIFLGTDPSAIYGTQIKGIRIGVNGREAESGQAFAAVNTTISPSDGYDPVNGQLLSSIGTIVASEFGPTGTPRDYLFLTLEMFAGIDKSAQYAEVVDTTLIPTTPQAVSDVMIRSFEEINASMAQITGVDRTISAIAGSNGTYTSVLTGLPGTADINTFVPAHQMAIAQLAIEYCNAFVSNPASRTIPLATYFTDTTVSNAIQNSTGLNFTDDVMNGYINPILERVNNAKFNDTTPANVDKELLTQAPTLNARTELKNLIGVLANASGCVGLDCSANAIRTSDILKATCSAAIANAAMLLQ